MFIDIPDIDFLAVLRILSDYLASKTLRMAEESYPGKQYHRPTLSRG